MGAYLSAPNFEKEIFDQEVEGCSVGVAALQGWRTSMEDSHVALLDFPQKGNALFAVFDGHGGAEVAKFAAIKIPQLVSSSMEEEDKGDVLRKSFMKIDDMIRDDENRETLSKLKNSGTNPSLTLDAEFEGSESGVTDAGCTAVAAYLEYDKRVIIANSGDSKAVMAKWTPDGIIAEELTIDHKPSLESEFTRIKNAGGCVYNGRVNGNLNLTRALGDLVYKNDLSIPPENQIISANPDIFVVDIIEHSQFLLLGCDGVWELMTPADVVRFVAPMVQKTRILRKENAPMTGDRLLGNMAGHTLETLVSPNITITESMGCDNMSLIIVDLKPNDLDSLRTSPKLDHSERMIHFHKFIFSRVDKNLPYFPDVENLDDDDSAVIESPISDAVNNDTVNNENIE